MNRIILFSTIFFFSIFYASTSSIAQGCQTLIEDNRIIEGTHLLRSKSQVMVVRGNYSYAIQMFYS